MAIADEDEFIKEIRDKTGLDPCDLPKLVVLRGYYAEGPVKNGKTRWRVYLNHALTDYYEGEDRDKEVVLVKDAPDEDGKLVWIYHGTNLRLVRSRAMDAEIPRPPHPLLGGPVTTAYLPTAPPVPPRWPPPYYQDPYTGWPGWGWDPNDPGWEVSKCRACPSASP